MKKKKRRTAMCQTVNQVNWHQLDSRDVCVLFVRHNEHRTMTDCRTDTISWEKQRKAKQNKTKLNEKDCRITNSFDFCLHFEFIDEKKRSEWRRRLSRSKMIKDESSAWIILTSLSSCWILFSLSPFHFYLQCLFVENRWDSIVKRENYSFDHVHSFLSFQQFDQIIFNDNQNGRKIDEKTRKRSPLNRIESLKDEFRSSFGSNWFNKSLFIIDLFISLFNFLFDFILFIWLDFLSNNSD